MSKCDEKTNGSYDNLTKRARGRDKLLEMESGEKKQMDTKTSSLKWSLGKGIKWRERQGLEMEPGRKQKGKRRQWTKNP